MGKPTGFMEYKREVWTEESAATRVKHNNEFHLHFSPEKLCLQGARCMDCGIPTCHAHGCPLGNLIPDWNDMAYRGRMRAAIDLLHHTNNFPEFTGRVCPAPCEKACTLAWNDDPVAIKLIELEVIEHAWRQGWVVPQPPSVETGKRVAVVGSGPAGLSAAQQLRRAGHAVTLFERDEKCGGLLRFGIPDFKLEKRFIDRRLAQMEAEGVTFRTGVDVGKDVTVDQLKKDFDAIVLALGAKTARDLAVPGRDLPGVHFAMDFLAQHNRRVGGSAVPKYQEILATGKRVVVIGGGDTGSDCVGTSIRQGALSVTQIELLPKPPEHLGTENPAWPDWPNILRTSSSHEEGCERWWSMQTKEIKGHGKAEKLVIEDLDWPPGPDGRPQLTVKPGTAREIDADLVILAMGFVHVEHGPLVKDLGVALDGRGNVVTDPTCATSVPGVWACGDTALGANLVVRAQAMGRKAALHVDKQLMGETVLADTTLL